MKTKSFINVATIPKILPRIEKFINKRKFFLITKIYEAKIEITYNCNLNCPFCFIKGMKHEEMPIGMFTKIVKLLKKFGIRHVRLTGGEPFLHRELKKFIDICKSLNLYITLNTNGTILNENTMKILDMIDEVNVSFHSTNTSDPIVNRKLMFLNKLSKKRILVCVDTVGTNKNIENFEKFYLLLKKYRIDYWTIKYLVPTAPGNESIDKKHVNLLIRKILKLKKTPFKICVGNFPLCATNPELAKKVSIGRRLCIYGNLTITPEGNLKLCYPFNKEILGNILKEGILAKFLKNRNEIFKKIIPTECLLCKYKNICGYGCRYSAYLNKKINAMHTLANGANYNFLNLK
jgi:radical SAM protein with 4Fe4S-binding SPASM domain